MDFSDEGSRLYDTDNKPSSLLIDHLAKDPLTNKHTNLVVSAPSLYRISSSHTLHLSSVPPGRVLDGAEASSLFATTSARASSDDRSQAGSDPLGGKGFKCAELDSSSEMCIGSRGEVEVTNDDGYKGEGGSAARDKCSVGGGDRRRDIAPSKSESQLERERNVRQRGRQHRRDSGSKPRPEGKAADLQVRRRGARRHRGGGELFGEGRCDQRRPDPTTTGS